MFKEIKDNSDSFDRYLEIIKSDRAGIKKELNRNSITEKYNNKLRIQWMHVTAD